MDPTLQEVGPIDCTYVVPMRRMRPGAKDPPAPSSSQAETPEIGDLPGGLARFSLSRNRFSASELVHRSAGTLDGIDDASGAPLMWRAFDFDRDALPITRVYPQQSGLKRSRDQAFGEDPDTPKKDPKRAQIDAREHPSRLLDPDHLRSATESLVRSSRYFTGRLWNVLRPQSSRDPATQSNQFSVKLTLFLHLIYFER